VRKSGAVWLYVAILTGASTPSWAQSYEITLGATVEAAVQQANQQPEAGTPEQSNPVQDARDRIYYPGDTEGVKPLTKKLVGNILLDQKELWTSPFHMHGNDAWWWLGFGGATAALIATDHRTSTVFENSKGQITWGNNLSDIGSSYTLLPLVAGFYSYGLFEDDPKAREVGVLGGEALLDSLIVVSVLKPIAGRNRPDAPNEKGEFFQGGASFPSGHAIAVWSLASVISYEYGHTKIVPIIACSLAAVVSLSRFAAQQHYASDLVAGGAMGWFIGRYVWKTHQDHALHPHGGLKAWVLPQIQPGSGTYALTLQIQP
jgi:membrane-associated phospholipid phosphatase